MNHYDVLGVPTSASPAEVRRAYVRLARQHHPDVHSAGGPLSLEYAEQRMREINMAWEVLRDDRQRLSYNRSIGVHAGAADTRVVTRS